MVITGALDSTTVNGTEQVVLLFDASLTVTVIGCDPTLTSVPAVGLCDLTNDVLVVQLSVADTSPSTFGTVA